jgi:hypothetical protein
VTAAQEQEPLAARVRFTTPRRVQHGLVDRHGEHQGVQQPGEIGGDDEQPRLLLLQQHDRADPVGRHAFEARAGPEVDPGVAERRPQVVPPRAHERARPVVHLGRDHREVLVTDREQPRRARRTAEHGEPGELPEAERRYVVNLGPRHRSTSWE